MGEKNSLERLIKHDGQVHHPLGAGSYVFERDYVKYLVDNIEKDKIKISIGAQPNSSPHFGTLTVFNLAFALGNRINSLSDKEASVIFEVVDTAPSETVVIDDINYQISLRESKISDKYLGEYYGLMNSLNKYSGVKFNVRKQSEFNSQENIPGILRAIIKKRDIIAPLLDPEDKLLKIRVACPDCGLTDKKGVKNEFFEDYMKSYCPNHGSFETTYEKESGKFEYNTPLRNLVRAISYGKNNADKNISHEYLRITGSDYAGYYQEQLLYKTASIIGQLAHELPTIIYSPLVLDWSGAKISKSLYVKKNAYKDLPNYLLNFAEFKEQLGEEGIEKIYNEISDWVDNSFKLFRHYTVYYFKELFENGK